jgi:sulfur carrier protein ThiS
MRAVVLNITNPFDASNGLKTHVIERRLSVSRIVERHKINVQRPVVCVLNNEPVLRRDWSTRFIKDNDQLSFVTVPLGGGGGSNPLRMVLTIALLYYAGPLATQIGGMAGIQSQLGMALLKAGITFVGQALINALIPAPSLPKPQAQAQMAAASPTYTLSAQGNQARIGQAIPVLYGRMKVFPDFAAQPYAEFENNDQFLYQLFLVTQGKAIIQLEDIFIEDSPLQSFGEAEIEVLLPGQKSNLFPTAVYNTAEINGQEVDGSNTVGPFSINPALTQINKVAFDIALSRGLYYANDAGGLDSRTVTVRLYVTPINDVGVATGPAQLLGVESISGATQTAIRKTFKYDVPVGRYSAHVQRGEAKEGSARVANDVNVISVRGYSAAQIDYGDVTMLAIKIKATNNISQQSSRKINCIAQRHLQIPTWNEITESYNWSIPQQTSSICWAIADMCRASYGANVDESRINMAQLSALNVILTARGDEFNGLFDSTQSFWDAVTLAARTGRMRPYVQGGMLNLVRNGLQTIPSAVFTSRQINPGSFKISYIMPSADTADCIDAEYFDEDVWKWRTVRAALDPEAQTKPAKVKFFGATKRNQVWREIITMAAENRWHRKRISFETELEGQLVSMGQLIGIQNPIPNWGQAADVVSYVGGVFTVDEMLEWTDGAQHYVMLRRPNGSAHAVREVVRGAEDNQFSLVAGQTIDFAPSTDFSKERTTVSFGRTGNVVQLAKVLSITSSGGNNVQIVAVNDDLRVYSADGEPVPEDLYNYGIQAPKTKPVLADFTVTQTGSGTTPSMAVSYPVAVGASRYFWEISTDNLNWATLAEVTTTSFSFLGTIGTLYIRGAAFGGLLGPYVTKTIEVGEIPPPPNVATGSITSNNQSYNVLWSEVPGEQEYYVEVLHDGSLKRSFRTVSTNFTYSLENAIADGGPWRAITVTIRARNGNVMSALPLVLSGSNAAPAAPTITLAAGRESISITVSKCNDGDYAGTQIFASNTPGFTPGPLNRIFDGPGYFFLHTPVTEKMYYKAAHYDTYGTDGLNYSAEFDSTPSTAVGGIEIVDAPLPDTGNYEGRVVYLTTTYTDVPSGVTYEGDKLYTFDADTDTWKTGGGGLPGPGEVTNDMLAGNITANKLNVANLAAINANMGAITAGSISLDTAGWISGGMSAYGVGTGFYLGYSSAAGGYVMQVGNSTKGFTWDGTDFTIKGNFLAGSVNINSRFEVANDGTVTIRSATTGARVVQTNDYIKVYDENNILRVQLGNLMA